MPTIDPTPRDQRGVSPAVDQLARLHRLAGDLAVELDALDHGAAELTGSTAERIGAALGVCRACIALVVDEIEAAAAGVDAPVVDAALDVARGLAGVDLDGLPVAAQAAWARQIRPVLGILVDALGGDR